MEKNRNKINLLVRKSGTVRSEQVSHYVSVARRPLERRQRSSVVRWCPSHTHRHRLGIFARTHPLNLSDPCCKAGWYCEQVALLCVHRFDPLLLLDRSSETVSSEAASSGFADLVVAVVTKKVGKRSVRVGSIDKDSL